MSRLEDIERRQVELAGLRELLQDTPDDPFAIPFLKSKIRALEAEIAKLQADRFPRPETDLYFINGPAFGSTGLDAKFAAQILDSYQSIIANQYASSHGDLRRSGRVFGENASKLFLSALPRGSFGLRLTQPTSQDFVAAGEIVEIMEKLPELLDAAAKSDDAFEATLDFFHPRVLIPLKAFVSAVANGKGAFRVISGEQRVELTHEQLVTVKERVDAAEKDEKPEKEKGTFYGNLLASRRFEFKPSFGSLIEGVVSKEVTEEQALEWSHLVGAYVEATLVVTRVTTRSGPKKPRYELSNLQILESPRQG